MASRYISLQAACLPLFPKQANDEDLQITGTYYVRRWEMR